MKKILYIALIVFTMLCTVIFGANINVEVTHASSQAVETKAEEYLNTFLSINMEFPVFPDKFPWKSTVPILPDVLLILLLLPRKHLLK